MKSRIEIVANALCLTVALGALAVAAWVVATGMPAREGLDAIFLIVVALAFAAFFGVMPARAFRRWWSSRRRAQAKEEARNDRGAAA